MDGVEAFPLNRTEEATKRSAEMESGVSTELFRRSNWVHEQGVRCIGNIGFESGSQREVIIRFRFIQSH